MANIAELKIRACEALNDILRTPVCVEVGTQTDFPMEEGDMLSLLRKRKNEVLFVVDKLLREEPAEETEEEESDEESSVASEESVIESVVTEKSSPITEKPSPLSSATITTDDTAHRTNVSQRRRMKLLKELARHQQIEYESENQLRELYHGLSVDDIIKQIPGEAEEPAVTRIKSKVDFIPLMNLPSITENQYKSISRDGQYKYVAAVVNRVRELKEIHGTPYSMRAVSHHYNLNYDTFYDAWRKRSSRNPYLI